MASEGNASTLCVNSNLPDEIVEEILPKLPLSGIIRARLVCKSWNRLLRSASFLHKLSASPPSSRKSWYLSLRSRRAYDLSVDSWWNLQFPSPTPDPSAPYYSDAAFSPGLVCSMAFTSTGLEFYVCNPITRLLRHLPDLPCHQRLEKYTIGLSMSAGRVPGTYIIAVITLEDIYPNVEEGTQVGIHVYSSEKLAWETREDVFLPIGCDSRQQSCVICDEVLYFQCRNYTGKFVCAYDLFSGSSWDISSFKKDLIPMPCGGESSFVMNMRGRLAMVGMSRESTKVRLLDGKEWVEVATMPNEYTTRLSIRFSRVCGFDEIIYIHDLSSNKLVIFDMATRRWRWIEGFSYVAKGTYFEPRFEAIP